MEQIITIGEDFKSIPLKEECFIGGDFQARYKYYDDGGRVMLQAVRDALPYQKNRIFDNSPISPICGGRKIHKGDIVCPSILGRGYDSKDFKLINIKLNITPDTKKRG